MKNSEICNHSAIVDVNRNNLSPEATEVIHRCLAEYRSIDPDNEADGAYIYSLLDWTVAIDLPEQSTLRVELLELFQRLNEMGARYFRLVGSLLGPDSNCPYIVTADESEAISYAAVVLSDYYLLAVSHEQGYWPAVKIVRKWADEWFEEQGADADFYCDKTAQVIAEWGKYRLKKYQRDRGPHL